MSSFLYISSPNVVLNHLLKLGHLIEATREKANISCWESLKTKQLIEKKHKRNPVLLWNFRNHCCIMVVQYTYREKIASQHCQTLLLFFFNLVGVEEECRPISTRLQYKNINGCVGEKEVPISHCEVKNKITSLICQRIHLTLPTISLTQRELLDHFTEHQFFFVLTDSLRQWKHFWHFLK